MISDNVAESWPNDCVVFRRFQQTSDEQIDVLWRFVNLLESFTIRWSKFVEILNDFVSTDSEVIIVWPESFITTALDVQRNQIESKGISATEKETRKLKKKSEISFKSK